MLVSEPGVGGPQRADAESSSRVRPLVGRAGGDGPVDTLISVNADLVERYLADDAGSGGDTGGGDGRERRGGGEWSAASNESVGRRTGVSGATATGERGTSEGASGRIPGELGMALDMLVSTYGRSDTSAVDKGRVTEFLGSVMRTARQEGNADLERGVRDRTRGTVERLRGRERLSAGDAETIESAVGERGGEEATPFEGAVPATRTSDAPREDYRGAFGDTGAPDDELVAQLYTFVIVQIFFISKAAMLGMDKPRFED